MHQNIWRKFDNDQPGLSNSQATLCGAQVSTTMPAYSLQQLCGLRRVVFSRYLETGMNMLLQCLTSIKESQIKWPSNKRVICKYRNNRYVKQILPIPIPCDSDIVCEHT
ncbi:hypothetical protein VP01_3253g3 [Puccinia sorghi]|uniref:Uncharacterized protein n=1 Tax=Puccinia sorghi TaxID=27349 RepID=A0A0L6UXX3_9BASI|nr:hypothetical protein VP01_3253g3 [Puccinia sorghi]